MLDNIEFTCPSYAEYELDSKNTLRYRNVNNKVFEYSVNSLPRALSVSYEKKCAKLENFINQHKTLFNLQNNLSQLYGFARSADGLIKDEYREFIWPVLAKNIPFVTKVKPLKCKQQNLAINLQSNNYNGDNDFNENYNSDSDFESAHSTFSNEFSEVSDDQFEKV